MNCRISEDVSSTFLFCIYACVYTLQCIELFGPPSYCIGLLHLYSVMNNTIFVQCKQLQVLLRSKDFQSGRRHFERCPRCFFRQCFFVRFSPCIYDAGLIGTEFEEKSVGKLKAANRKTGGVNDNIK